MSTARKAVAGMLPTFILGSVLLTAGTLVHVATPEAQGCGTRTQSVDPAALCYDDEKAHAEQARDAAAEPLAILAAQGSRDCSPAAKWTAGDVASWVVVKRTSGEVVGLPFDEAWALAQAGEAWTLTLCA